MANNLLWDLQQEGGGEGRGGGGGERVASREVKGKGGGEGGKKLEAGRG